MNDLFVNIKVDREERPDVDAIYMAALHELGEQGGWPLTMFLTSDAEPFWGGTYFRKEARYGRPAFTQVLKEIARIYRDEQGKVRQNADTLKDRLAPKLDESGPARSAGDAALADLARRLLQLVDPTHGGIRGAPKFPQVSSSISCGARAPLRRCPIRSRRSSHADPYRPRRHLRSSRRRLRPLHVDERWLVPHFEKMLYDNALLLELMTEVWRETKSPLLACASSETVDWLLREMVTEEAALPLPRRRQRGRGGQVLCVELAEIEEVLGPDDANSSPRSTT